MLRKLKVRKKLSRDRMQKKRLEVQGRKPGKRKKKKEV